MTRCHNHHIFCSLSLSDQIRALRFLGCCREAQWTFTPHALQQESPASGHHGSKQLSSWHVLEQDAQSLPAAVMLPCRGYQQRKPVSVHLKTFPSVFLVCIFKCCWVFLPNWLKFKYSSWQITAIFPPNNLRATVAGSKPGRKQGISLFVTQLDAY